MYYFCFLERTFFESLTNLVPPICYLKESEYIIYMHRLRLLYILFAEYAFLFFINQTNFEKQLT